MNEILLTLAINLLLVFYAKYSMNKIKKIK